MTVERIVEILNQYPDISFADEGDSIAVKDIVPLLERQIPVTRVLNEKLMQHGWPDVYNCGGCGHQLCSISNFCELCGRPLYRAMNGTPQEKVPDRCYDCEECTKQEKVSYMSYMKCKKTGRMIYFNEENGYDRMKWCPLIREGLN